MSQYFFHLRLELYSKPASNSSKRIKIAHEHRSDIYIPAFGTDIFEIVLPAHKVSKWPERNHTFTPSSIDDRSSSFKQIIPSVTTPHLRDQRPDHSETPGGALLLPERSANLRKDVPPSPRAQLTLPSNHSAASDWRYDTVSIESIDMDSVKQKRSSTGGLHTKATYLPSDTKTTDVGYGVVHLYRDTEETLALNEFRHDKSTHGKSSAAADIVPKSERPEDCTTLCILAVPSWMLPSDLLGFVGDQAREDVSHFRLIRTGRANKYMVLMKFRSSKKARDWHRLNNGRVFSAAEPENCHVVFIQSVEFFSPDSETSIAKFPQNLTDSFVQATKTNRTSNISSKPLAPPPPNLLELPTCPVCLERMDETTGLLTILCQHVFHCACLEKWRGSGCPVCRYTHSPSFTFPFPRPHDSTDVEEAEPVCSVCASTSSLWICLICGNIGCGRYDSAHAYAHYEATSHCYAMDVSSQRVWDYAGDGYVHRLIQNKAAPESFSKSPAELPTRTRHENEAFRAEGGDSVPREKMENMANEYAYLLTSQLEGQRRYFEEQMERAVDKAAEALARAGDAASTTAATQLELTQHRATQEQMLENLRKLEASLERSEKLKTKFEQMARDMSTKLREEKTMNEGLLARIKAADLKAENAMNEAESAKREKAELEEMNHDLTMFISSQEKVKELQAQGEDVVDGSVSIPTPPPPNKKGKGKGKKKA